MKTFEEIKAVCDTVPGWMDDNCLRTIHEIAGTLPPSPQVLEIGVYAGKSLIDWAMTIAHKNGTVWGLDVFAKNKQNPDCPEFAATEKDLHLKGIDNFELMQGDSSILSERFSGSECFDVIFIDGSHDYESVTQDINNSLPFLKPSGILCGHDAFHAPVKEATAELLGTNIKTNGMIWTYKKEEQ